MATSNAERFRALYERHHPTIIAYFVRRIGSQDTLDALLESITGLSNRATTPARLGRRRRAAGAARS